MNFNKILIANRGEIAVRIIKSAKELGIGTVAVFAELEKKSLYIEMADEAFSLGDGDLKDTYLNINKIIEIAQNNQVDAIHPGYGFLAENPLFVEACEKANISFIGPSAKSMQLMGNKIAAREFIQSINIPATKGITGSNDELLKAAINIPFPILIKAAAGGGGKGMRIVHHDNGLKDALEATSREALNYFGDAAVYIEQYIENPRHIEVQVLGDNFGNVIHLYERECSIQRRYQKIIEESPSPTLTDSVRNEMCAAAVEIAKKIGYSNAGTIEFLLDENMKFYFLEMNTRIQVEHPVTEMVTGIDIVKEQILIAAGNKLSFKQDAIKQKGHAIECRIYAENPSVDFMPSPGLMSFYKAPVGENIRIDSGIDKAVQVDSAFDPMISKLITWDKDRPSAIKQSIEALNNYVIQGIVTNISFLKEILHDSDYITNKISTHYIANNLNHLLKSEAEKKQKVSYPILIAAYLSKNLVPKANTVSVWNTIGFWRELMNLQLTIDGKTQSLNLHKNTDQIIEFELNKQLYSFHKAEIKNEKVILFQNNLKHALYVSFEASGKGYVSFKGFTYGISRNDVLAKTDVYEGKLNTLSANVDSIISPMHGKILKLNVKVGDSVAKGANLLIVEAMKMENQIKAPRNAVIRKINVKVNDKVTSNSELIVFEKSTNE